MRASFIRIRIKDKSRFDNEMFQVFINNVFINLIISS